MIAHISNDGLDREETVEEHTRKTTFLCIEKGKRCGLSYIMELCGVFHDMGKCKKAFNDYIHADEKTRQKQRGSIAHASTGAKYIYDKYHDNSGNTKILAEMISYAVAAHHGLFDCVDAERNDIFVKRLKGVRDYDEACRNAEEGYLNGYKQEQTFQMACQEFCFVWGKLKDLFKRVRSGLLPKYGKDAGSMLYEFKFFQLACLQRLVLSLLIDSDWEATSDFMNGVDTLSKQSQFEAEEVFAKAQENFDNYMERKRQITASSVRTYREKQIFAIRDSLQEECRRFAKHPAGIYCLPIPTGGGKTLSSLAYALEFCRRHPETERIIYVSPYISITEQNAKVFRDAIGDDNWILEHHSSVLRDEGTESEDYRSDRTSRYDINWEEPFICTTFVQFMNTLFSDRSESIRRMHRLANAVVIIDEVQSMPLKCVHTFNYMINFLNAICNTNVILCTATQPTLEEAECPLCYSEQKYMIKNIDALFDKLERVKVYTPEVGEKYTFESLADEIAACTAEYRSILVVLNTKSAVRRLYDFLKERNIHAEYLTTNLCAEHRSDRLDSIKAELDKKTFPIVIVSTSLIEAGVDISCECVYRSMTGLDSLAQTAGRCNRNGEIEWGMVHLIELEDENTGNMEELQQSVRVTEKIIDQYHESKKLGSLLKPQWMDRYYKEVYSAAADKMNFPIGESDGNVLELLSGGFSGEDRETCMNQAYKTAGQAYQVIDDNSFGVIVPYGKGTEIIEQLGKAENEKEIKRGIRQAQRYTVNVRGNQLKKFEGFIQPVSDRIPNLYMAAFPKVYSEEYGITPEWEMLIF